MTSYARDAKKTKMPLNIRDRKYPAVPPTLMLLHPLYVAQTTPSYNGLAPSVATRKQILSTALISPFIEVTTSHSHQTATL